MNTEDLFIIAIELSSSNVTGIAGKKQSDSTISVQAVVQRPSSDFIRRGMVVNMDKTVQCIREIIETLEERLKRKIKQVYVGFGGQGIHSVVNKVSKPLCDETRVSKELVDSLLNENLDVKVGNNAILEVIPQEYVTGKEISVDPVGNITENIEGTFVNVVARPSLKANIENCFKEVGIHCVGTSLVALSEANVLLTESEKRSGCVLVDFGADTTSLVIYKNNLVRYMAVIPFGSANITKDILTCNIEEDDAEHLKLTQGCALGDNMTPEEEDEVLHGCVDGTSLTRRKLTEIIEARVQEILMNVNEFIKISGYDRAALMGGAVFTGGGSNLKNMAQAFTKFTNISQIRFVKGVQNITFAKNIGIKAPEGKYIGTLCVLSEGTQNCCGEETNSTLGNVFDEKPFTPQSEEQETPTEVKDESTEVQEKPKKPSIFSTLGKKIGEFLGED